MPLTPKEFEQIKKYVGALAAGELIGRTQVIDFLADYVDEPKIVASTPIDLQALLAAQPDPLKEQAKQILQQRGQREDATGGCMAELVGTGKEGEPPTYVPISEGMPAGAYLPVDGVVYQLHVEAGGRKRLVADAVQTERYQKQQRGG